MIAAMVRFLRGLISIVSFLIAAMIALSGFSPDVSWVVAGGGAAIFAGLGRMAWPKGAEVNTKRGRPAPSPGDRSSTISPRGNAPNTTSSKTRWYPSGQTVRIGAFTIPDGMVYFGSDGRNRSWRSTIDPSYNVARSRPGVDGPTMGYWPSYSDMRPEGRLAYLSWLSKGRCTPIDIGYVFVFFYGLERRLFADQAFDETADIREEVNRLVDLYGENRSFSHYAQRLLDTIDGLTALGSDAVARLPEVRSPPEDYEFPLNVRVEIGRKLCETAKLDGKWMFVWHANHPETSFRVPAQRAFLLYRALFIIRFNEAHPDGLTIALPKKKITVIYQAASSDFEAEFSADLPEIVDLSRPWKAADAIASQCQEDLAKYSRFVGKHPTEKSSPKALALLPFELASTIKTPETDAIRKWLDDNIPNRLGYISSRELIGHLKLDPGNGTRISKTAMRQASDLLKNFGTGIEPDPETSGYSPSLDEPMVLFRLPKDRQAGVSEAFLFASLSTTLSVAVANADGVIDQGELQMISEAAARNPNLTEMERMRLAARAVWLMKVPPSLSKLRSSLSNLQDIQRSQLANVAVEMSLADGDVAPDEVKLLEKVFKFLGLPQEQVFSAIHSAQAHRKMPGGTDDPVTVRIENRASEFDIPEAENLSQDTPFSLDTDAVSKIRAETEIVSAVLTDVFQTDDENVSVDPIDEGAEIEHVGLDKRHKALLDGLTEQNRWSIEDYQALCKSFDLLPGGALETLNEWAYDQFDDSNSHFGIFEWFWGFPSLQISESIAM